MFTGERARSAAGTVPEVPIASMDPEDSLDESGRWADETDLWIEDTVRWSRRTTGANGLYD